MKTNPLTRMTQVLFYFNAAVWVVLGITSLTRIDSAPSYVPWIIAVLMFSNAAALALCGWGSAPAEGAISTWRWRCWGSISC